MQDRDEIYFKASLTDITLSTSEKSSKVLLLPSTKYWNSLDEVLTHYILHDDHKFDYADGIAHRKHIVTDRIRYIGKESNNLDEVNVLGIDDSTYMEYDNSNEFYNWILLLKPRTIKEWGISKIGLKKVKQKIRNGKGLKYKSKIIKILYNKYKESNLIK